MNTVQVQSSVLHTFWVRCSLGFFAFCFSHVYFSLNWVVTHSMASQMICVWGVFSRQITFIRIFFHFILWLYSSFHVYLNTAHKIKRNKICELSFSVSLTVCPCLSVCLCVKREREMSHQGRSVKSHSISVTLTKCCSRKRLINEELFNKMSETHLKSMLDTPELDSCLM